MAQHAFARPCTRCTTLTTFAGNYVDETYAARCPCCGSDQVQPNPSGVAPSTPAPETSLEAKNEPGMDGKEADFTEAVFHDNLGEGEFPHTVEVADAPA